MRSAQHRSEIAPSPLRPKPLTSHCDRAGRLRSGPRRDARLGNFALIDEVIRAHGVTVAEIAASAGVDESIIRDALDGHAGDPLWIVDFFPRSARRDAFIRKAQQSERSAPAARVEVLALLVSHRNGELDGAIAVALANDGEIDDDERASILPLAAALETRAHDLVLSLGGSR